MYMFKSHNFYPTSRKLHDFLNKVSLPKFTKDGKFLSKYINRKVVQCLAVHCGHEWAHSYFREETLHVSIVGVSTPILQRGNLMRSTSRVWVYHTSERKLYIPYTILQRGSPTCDMSWMWAHNTSQRKPYIYAVDRLQRGNLTCSMSWVWAHHLSERKPYVQCTILQRGNLMCCTLWMWGHPHLFGWVLLYIHRNCRLIRDRHTFSRSNIVFF